MPGKSGAKDLRAAIRGARSHLREHADAAAAPQRKRYLKSPFRVLGARVPDMRKAAKLAKGAAAAADMEVLEAGLAGLWKSNIHEDRMLAIFIAENVRGRFDAGHVSGLFKAWLLDSSNWDFVDSICNGLIGPIAEANPIAWSEIESWAGHDWMWLRRAAIVAQIPAARRLAFDAERLERTIDALIDEHQFFIAKAIGWVLREISKKDPDAAEKLIRRFHHRAAKLTIREATKRLPPSP
ncbi:MAG: DNA alkylation repair protein [Rhodospirillales bacterium]|jgi:3-methyladenine DNA glycosylase AlkD|nr:hypothetical protein [Rhodospirillaceae bacterium]MDP6428929.1 DNA alkylation repair protein [Rhodospirillales bacterium]MDP6644956.1 DNA alkylation repair protein [Rhodospirillales bacterium]MDP6840508.1 DNA alkylation repair protein [Rhodospirillales bacterium]